MSDMDINQVIAQMRVMASAAGAPATETAAVAEGENRPDFGKLLAESIQAVSDNQLEAGAMKKAFEAGEEGLELPEVMVALQKASLSFQAMNQVRNKLLSAYQEVMNMQV